MAQVHMNFVEMYRGKISHGKVAKEFFTLWFQVVNTVTSNHECVSNIAESQVLANLLLLLHSLPSSKPFFPSQC